LKTGAAGKERHFFGLCLNERKRSFGNISMAAGSDRSTIERIQQANDIVEIIAEHLHLVKKGREMVGLCPFHDDHKPSMCVSPHKQIFKCFACGAGGDVIKFVQMRENLSFPQAIERLGKRAGIKLPKKGYSSGAKREGGVDPNRLAKLNSWAADYFIANLVDGEKGKVARDYLKGRQIDSAAVKQWNIGFAAGGNDLVKHATEKKFPMDLLVKAGFVAPGRGGGGYTDKFVNRVMFPIRDVTGRVIGFGGRCLDGTGAKYINSPATGLFDKSNCLYGLYEGRHEIVKSGSAAIVEGYTDVIMAHSKGVCNVVATLGTSFTDGHARIIKRYGKKIVLVFDSDTAGLEAANRALGVCLSQRIDIKLATLPAGNDPCDFILSEGAEKFEQILAAAVDVFAFKWERLVEQFGSDNLIDQKAAIEEFINTVATGVVSGNLSPIETGLIVNKLSSTIGMNARDINAELSKQVSRNRRNLAHNSRGQGKSEAGLPDLGSGLCVVAQREILEVLLNTPRLLKSLDGMVTSSSFDVPVLGQIAEIVFETIERETNPSIAQFLASTESAELSALIVELAETGLEKGNFSKRLSCAAGVLEQHERKKQSGADVELKTRQQQQQYIREISKNSKKQNSHNLGMI